MSTTVNKERAKLFYGFTNQLAIADIKLTYAFFEEVKHHWSSFSVPEILQQKLHLVVVNNVNAEVKVRWLKFWNDNRFDKYVPHFSKSSLYDFALHEWLSKSTYWAQLEKKSNEELHCILSSSLQFLTNVLTLSEYI